MYVFLNPSLKPYTVHESNFVMYSGQKRKLYGSQRQQEGIEDPTFNFGVAHA